MKNEKKYTEEDLKEKLVKIVEYPNGTYEIHTEKLILRDSPKVNKSNPRVIKDADFKKLVKSIKEFPEMLELRPIVVDEDGIILGGNMRYQACIEAGIKEKDIPKQVAKGFTDAQKKEFIIKDNASSGEWDWDILANEWDTKELNEWGVQVWQNMDDIVDSVNKGDEFSEWVGMPEFESKEEPFKIVVSFLNEKDRDAFVNEKDMQVSLAKEGSRTWSTTYPFKEREDIKSLRYE